MAIAHHAKPEVLGDLVWSSGPMAEVCASKAASGRPAPLHFGGRRVRRLSCGAQPHGPSPNSLRALRALRSNRRRRISPLCALRARATSAAFLGAEEALRPPPARGFAGNVIYLRRRGQPCLTLNVAGRWRISSREPGVGVSTSLKIDYSLAGGEPRSLCDRPK